MSTKTITILVLSMLLIPSISSGQGAYDALRYSQLYYSGTARSLSMGNAFTAIGGDMGAITINPAASGVYRYGEVAITPGVSVGMDQSEYLGYRTDSSRPRFTLSNIGWVGTFSTGRKRGLLNMNVAITANQTNNFATRTSASGDEAYSSYLGSEAAYMTSTGIPGYRMNMPDNNIDEPFYYSGAPWSSILEWNSYLLDTLGSLSHYIGATENIAEDGKYYNGGKLNQKYRSETTGYMQDIILNTSGNISDVFFFGASITMQNVWYNKTTTYSETAYDPEEFQSGFMYFKHNSNQSTSGYGINLKAGFLFRPIAGLSIGGAISTPTWLFLTERYDQSIEADFLDLDKTISISSPLGRYEYKVTAPFRWNLGVAYTLGKRAVISAEYEMADYSKIKMDASDYDFGYENKYIKETMKTANNVRVGAEVRVTPAVSVRAGYSFYDNAEKEFIGERHYASLGLGYRSEGGFFIDAAYQQQCNHTTEFYSLYNDYDNGGFGVPVLKSRYLNWQLLVTLGFRF